MSKQPFSKVEIVVTEGADDAGTVPVLKLDPSVGLLLQVGDIILMNGPDEPLPSWITETTNITALYNFCIKLSERFILYDRIQFYATRS